METKKVPGRNKNHKVLMYALSTCGWCKRMKQFLAESSVEYEYVDVDLCTREERDEIRNDILNRGGRLSYPTIIIDDNVLITGFQIGRVKEVLGL